MCGKWEGQSWGGWEISTDAGFVALVKGGTHLSQPATTNPAEQMLPLYFTTVSAVPAARTAGAGRGFDEGTLSQLQDMAGRSGEQCVSTAATEAHYKQEEHVMNYVSMTMKRLGYKKLIFKNVSKERVQKKVWKFPYFC